MRTGVELATLVPPVGGNSPCSTVPADPKLAFDLYVDGSTTKQRIDLSDLLAASQKGKAYTGVDMARLMTDRINRQFGDERYFNFDGELFETTAAGTKDTLMTLALGDSGTPPVTASVNIKLGAADWEPNLTGQITPENLVDKKKADNLSL